MDVPNNSSSDNASSESQNPHPSSISEIIILAPISPRIKGEDKYDDCGPGTIHTTPPARQHINDDESLRQHQTPTGFSIGADESGPNVISNVFTPSSDSAQNALPGYGETFESPGVSLLNRGHMRSENLYSAQRPEEQFVSSASKRIRFSPSYQLRISPS